MYLQLSLHVATATATHLGSVDAGASLLALAFPCKHAILELYQCHLQHCRQIMQIRGCGTHVVVVQVFARLMRYSQCTADINSGFTDDTVMSFCTHLVPRKCKATS